MHLPFVWIELIHVPSQEEDPSASQRAMSTEYIYYHRSIMGVKLAFLKVKTFDELKSSACQPYGLNIQMSKL